MKKISFLFIFLFVLSFFSISVFADTPKKDFPAVVKEMDALGDQLAAAYKTENSMDTMDGFSKLYFDHYEGSGMEVAVAAISPAINAKTEALFTQIIGAASNNAAPLELQKKWTALKIRLHADLELVQKSKTNNFTQTFIQSFSILLREGFEALIIVTALLAYLRRSEHADKSPIIYTGVLLALFASIATAYIFTTIFKNLGANREAMEGIIMLIASGVLFYVSYWLFSKSEAVKWQNFIKNKMNKALSSSNMFALGLAAFLAVYREGAETILFYQALIFESKGASLAVTSGLIGASATLLLLYIVLQKASFKIPYRLFFTATAILLYYMAFSFIGGGILELQQAGLIDITPIKGFPQIEWLGIFPAWQNVGAQLAFLIPTLLGLIWYYKKRAIKNAEV